MMGLVIPLYDWQQQKTNKNKTALKYLKQIK